MWIFQSDSRQKVIWMSVRLHSTNSSGKCRVVFVSFHDLSTAFAAFSTDINVCAAMTPQRKPSCCMDPTCSKCVPVNGNWHDTWQVAKHNATNSLQISILLVLMTAVKAESETQSRTLSLLSCVEACYVCNVISDNLIVVRDGCFWMFYDRDHVILKIKAVAYVAWILWLISWAEHCANRCKTTLVVDNSIETCGSSSIPQRSLKTHVNTQECTNPHGGQSNDRQAHSSFRVAFKMSSLLFQNRISAKCSLSIVLNIHKTVVGAAVSCQASLPTLVQLFQHVVSDVRWNKSSQSKEIY